MNKEQQYRQGKALGDDRLELSGIQIVRSRLLPWGLGWGRLASLVGDEINMV